ncbi:MAG: NUDIX hydrolase [Candidatus Dojkabacteria bacterium]
MTNSYYNPSPSDLKDELLTHVDENDNVISSVRREECHNESSKPWHRTIHVYLLNSKGELLLTKRSTTKDTSPNQIIATGAGHVRYGEDPLTTAEREMFEELGLDVKLKFIKKYKIDYGFEREFIYVYFSTVDSKPVLNSVEVAEVIYVPLDEFKDRFVKREIFFAPGSQEVCEMLIADGLLERENF